MKPNATPIVDPRLLLQRELERRCQSNPRYSLRAFARALGVSPAGLSYMMSGRRPVSRKTAARLMSCLSLTPDECAALEEWSGTRRSRPRSHSLAGPSAAQSPVVNTHQLSLDSFAFISDWYHYGILSLLEIRGARFDPRWIARHLGITEAEARAAMERLTRLGIVEKTDRGWHQAVGPIRIASDVPTGATKKFQKQLLLKGVESIENDPDDVKDFSSMTLAMDPTLVPYAKERIRAFRRELTAELEARGAPQRVYKLTVQIFPVSRSIHPKANQEKDL